MPEHSEDSRHPVRCCVWIPQSRDELALVKKH